MVSNPEVISSFGTRQPGTSLSRWCARRPSGSPRQTDPPREYGREGPVWRVDFKAPDAASFYVDAMSGDVKTVRTGLWRTFDFMWGLHIMDWSSRENFNSWWIKATASLAVAFFVSGLCLVVLRLRSALRRRRPSRL